LVREMNMNEKHVNLDCYLAHKAAAWMCRGFNMPSIWAKHAK
jgi:hypothetical protein